MVPGSPWRLGACRARTAVLIGLVAALVLVALGCAKAIDDRPPPVAERDGWERIIVGEQLKDEVATIAGIDWLDTGAGTWTAFGTYQERPGGLVKPAAWASGHATRWEKVGVPVPADEGGEVRAAGSGGGLAYLVGAVGTGTAEVPAIWRSADGWRWDQPMRLPLPPGTSGGITAVAIAPSPAAAGGWLVAGQAVAGVAASPVLWHSADGVAWSLVKLPSADALVGAGGYAVAGLASRPGAAVMVLDPTEPARSVVVARSDDGMRWVTESLVGTTSVRSVVAAGDHFLLAGDCCDLAQDQLGRTTGILVSADGASWAPGMSPGGPVVDVAVDRHNDPEQLYALTLTGDEDGELALFRRPVERPEDVGAWVQIDLPGWFAGGNGWSDDGRLRPVIAASGGAVVWNEPSPRGHQLWVSGVEPTFGWERADVEPFPPPIRTGSDQVMALAVSTSGETAVAVGYRGELASRPAAVGEAETDARVWVASDPRRWEEVAVSKAIVSVNDVIAIPQGFYAVGVRRRSDGVLRPAWLRSADGRKWERLDLMVPEDPADSPTFLPARVIRPAQLFVAGGAMGSHLAPPRPEIRTSGDGVVWEAAAVPEVPGSGAITGLCAWDEGIVAVGSARVGVEPQDEAPFVWTSVDGRSWTSLRLGSLSDPANRIAGCAIDDGGQVTAVGWKLDADGGSRPAAWTWNLRADDGGAIETILERGGPAGEAGERTPARVVSVSVDGASWIAVGSGGAAPGNVYPLVWTSIDGSDWTLRPDITATVTGSGNGVASAVSRWHDRALIAGSHDDAGLLLAGPPSR